MQDTNLSELRITGALTTFEYCLSSEKRIYQFKTTTYFFRMRMHLKGSLWGAFKYYISRFSQILDPPPPPKISK